MLIISIISLFLHKNAVKICHNIYLCNILQFVNLDTDINWQLLGKNVDIKKSKP